MLKYLHVPVAPEKIEGPATCLTFFGIELGTVALEMRLPLEKKVDFLGTVARILETNHVTSHELASVVGKLSFASRAIPAGWTFLRQLYDFMRATPSAKPYLSLILPGSVCDDLVWWAEALTSYSGRPAHDMQLQTDASGSIGFGTVYNGKWLHSTWDSAHLPLSITFKELYAIVVACHTWGHEWTRRRIMFQSDNTAVVQCIKTGTCRSKPVMALIRSLYWLCVKYSFLISASHIQGVTNTLADALSRGLLQSFKILAPTASPSAMPPVLPQLPSLTE